MLFFPLWLSVSGYGEILAFGLLKDMVYNLRLKVLIFKYFLIYPLFSFGHVHFLPLYAIVAHL